MYFLRTAEYGQQNVFSYLSHSQPFSTVDWDGWVKSDSDKHCILFMGWPLLSATRKKAKRAALSVK